MKKELEILEVLKELEKMEDVKSVSVEITIEAEKLEDDQQKENYYICKDNGEYLEMYNIDDLEENIFKKNIETYDHDESNEDSDDDDNIYVCEISEDFFDK